MKNTLGSAVTLTIFGESHGEEIGAVLDGLAPGIRVDEGEIAARLAQRRPSGAISTARSEPDPFRIVSGVLGGYTTGTPIAILIPNTQVRSGDYQALSGKARPGHADYAAEQKYHGYQDERGGGHFSGRVTAALVAAGAICRAALREKGVELGSHILSLGGKWDRPFSTDEKALLGELRALDRMDFAVLDEQAGEAMKEAILTAKAEGDSVGGRLESAVCGLAAGLGEPWFDSVESMLSHALFSIGGVKGVAFGDGFDLCDMRGSEANDPSAIPSRDGWSPTPIETAASTAALPTACRCASSPPSSLRRPFCVPSKRWISAAASISR